MIHKVYTFTDDSWWDDNGCDCCEPTLMECYNTDDFPQNGSAHSLEDCYFQVLEYEGIVDEDWEGSSRELRKLIDENRIMVVIED